MDLMPPLPLNQLMAELSGTVYRIASERDHAFNLLARIRERLPNDGGAWDVVKDQINALLGTPS